MICKRFIIFADKDIQPILIKKTIGPTFYVLEKSWSPDFNHGKKSSARQFFFQKNSLPVDLFSEKVSVA